MAENDDHRAVPDARKRGYDVESDLSENDERDARQHKRLALDEVKEEIDDSNTDAKIEDAQPNPDTAAPGQAMSPTADAAANANTNASSSGGAAQSQQPSAGSSAPALALRSLVTTKDAGIIIGKSGKNVSEIRDKSGARITISEMVPGAQERILTVSGAVDAVAKAYALVARKILDETSAGHNSEVTATSIRMLAPHSRMGGIIGKSGSKIKEIQEASGARILASENMLPESTERTVTVSGVPDAIHIAAFHIGKVLQEQSDRTPPTVLYKPSSSRVSGNHAAYGGGASMDPYAAAVAGYGSAYGAAGAGSAAYAHSGASGHHHQPSHHQGHHASASQSHRNPPPGSQAQQIFIPNDMVGCIIGKGGSKINEIRQLSGSSIKIAEPHGNTHERLVTITGTPESNQMALYLLYSRLEAEKGRMAAAAAGGY